MQVNSRNIVLTTIILLTLSCTVPKDARILKRSTKDWRNSQKVLWGYSDTPIGSSTLTLRDNHKFELASSGFFIFWFEAGTWTIRHDTIVLEYVDKNKAINRTQNVYIDRNNSKLYFKNADATVLTLRILSYNIKD